MNSLSFKRSTCLWLLISAALLGCGRKEMPQPITDSTAKPHIEALQSKQVGLVLRLDFTLTGNPAGVGYQIDRTMIDPYCNCPGFWRRFIDQEAIPRLANHKIKRILKLSSKTGFVFRIRAIDADGNLGPWSHMIRAHGVDLFHK